MIVQAICGPHYLTPVSYFMSKYENQKKAYDVQ